MYKHNTCTHRLPTVINIVENLETDKNFENGNRCYYRRILRYTHFYYTHYTYGNGAMSSCTLVSRVRIILEFKT